MLKTCDQRMWKVTAGGRERLTSVAQRLMTMYDLAAFAQEKCVDPGLRAVAADDCLLCKRDSLLQPVRTSCETMFVVPVLFSPTLRSSVAAIDNFLVLPNSSVVISRAVGISQRGVLLEGGSAPLPFVNLPLKL